MASHSWDLLDPKEEEELFKTRLLNVEEKPFKRVTKLLPALWSLVTRRCLQEQTPPPDGPHTSAAASPDSAQFAVEVAQVKEDFALAFAALDDTIKRLQFLSTANEKERARYAADRVDIQNKCQDVRDNTATLRVQLEEARATLEQRKKFDELAEKITSNRLLRPRADQLASLQKLEEECKQLEEESETYAETWRERKDQFAKIMDESMRLRRLIRDEKEEVERREGMDDEGGEGGAAEGAEEGQTPRPGIASGNATPHPESGMVPKTIGGLESGDAGTPRPASTFGGRTPARASPAPDTDGLKPRSFSRSGSRAPSREPSLSRDEPEEGEDVEMDDAGRATGTPVEGGQTAGTPRITVDGQDIAGEKMDET